MLCFLVVAQWRQKLIEQQRVLLQVSWDIMPALEMVAEGIDVQGVG